MRRLRFEVAYDGTDFHGWQSQPELATIQGTLELVVSEIEGQTVTVEASGRTDAGVHALAQVAAVSLHNPIPVDNFRRAVNRLLPRSIRVSNVVEVDPAFHPRFDAVRKTYEYRIYREEVCPPFVRNFVTHHPYPLREDLLDPAAACFLGTHDFRAFAASDPAEPAEKDCVRKIYLSEMARIGPLLIFRICGSGFLKHMVRNIVGVLLEVGKQNLMLTDVEARLKPGCGIPAGPRAPASGLFLVQVEYAPKTNR